MVPEQTSRYRPSGLLPLVLSGGLLGCSIGYDSLGGVDVSETQGGCPEGGCGSECAGGPCCDNTGTLRPSDYACEPMAELEYGCPWGLSGGDNVGVRHRDMMCSGESPDCDGALSAWSSWSVADQCASDEVCKPGEPVCTSPGDCQQQDYWTPPLNDEADETGLQFNQAIDVALQLEVRQQTSQLEFRVCKLNDGLFQQNVWVEINDTAPNGNAGAAVTLETMGLSCSAWTGMDNDEAYQEGEVYSGAWKIVSPSISAPDWAGDDSCIVVGSPTGSCWHGSDIILKRTCKE